MYKFYANNFTTADGEDLLTQFRSECGNSSATVKSLTLIAGAELHVKINGGEYSALYLDTDGKYKLTLPIGTVLVSSLITQEDAISVWFAGAY